MSCFEPTSIACGFLLVSAQLPSWRGRLDLFVFLDAGFAATAIVDFATAIAIDGSWALITGRAHGSHAVFSYGPYLKGALKMVFLNIPINIYNLKRKP